MSDGWECRTSGMSDEWGVWDVGRVGCRTGGMSDGCDVGRSGMSDEWDVVMSDDVGRVSDEWDVGRVSDECNVGRV